MFSSFTVLTLICSLSSGLVASGSFLTRIFSNFKSLCTISGKIR